MHYFRQLSFTYHSILPLYFNAVFFLLRYKIYVRMPVTYNVRMDVMPKPIAIVRQLSSPDITYF